ncbi:hypothetical protein COHA_001329 [Chlorella ohadii]|uniref:Uncharacterized protein n=1 Tax=Chlorella ohadii TaxID=2649997 RepID=A0AAD5DZJ3_9CHLO|nr:hypothetical protein COHA_001329 [Chlorella ohadii]
MSPAKFSWIPKVDLYPLFTVFGAAIGVVGYASYRGIAHNPSVSLTQQQKQDVTDETGWTLERANKYYHSIFRSAALSRATGEERPDVRIMRF